MTEVTDRIKNALEGSFRGIWLEGEISRLTRAPSGHIYLTLKDSRAQIQAVVWRSTAARLKFDLESGQEVLACGDVTVYPPRGSYQLTISKLEPKGVGALQLAFRQLVERLSKEGLFDEARKKALPYMPEHIGVITSPTGAALRDILNVIDRRFPRVHVVIYPVVVQGEKAAGEIAAAIDTFNLRGDMEVLIVGRGGGSPEDLWAFNEEVVARAIYRSEIPIISAVGHEIDYMVSDMVADRRALTPTEAAEIVLPREADLKASLDVHVQRLRSAILGRASVAKERLRQMRARHGFRIPAEKIRQNQQAVDERGAGLGRSIAVILGRWKDRIGSTAARLETLSPLRVLGRGYSITLRQEDGAPLRDANEVAPGDSIETRLARGRLKSRVTETTPQEP
ncbi:MAG: exodeoxyribonuclease VII large subunit [Planctomycetota bacterium]|nr:exodeoxyribonuclease VII large subunit [Planctomycetota bacterium]